MDSSPHGDDTADVARGLGAQVLAAPPGGFNHGLTREWGRRALGTDVVVMMTQDAVIKDSSDVARLVAPVVSRRVAAAYGRQVPRDGAGLLERFPRAFSYPPTSEVRSAADIPRIGSRAFFFSNAFACWDNAALDVIGGFPETLSHEDAITAARLLRAGFTVGYVGDAVCVHSHSLGPADEFRRYFDAGAARARYHADLGAPGVHNSEGRRYVEGLLREARVAELPGAVAHVAARLAGFTLGRHSGRFPPRVSRHLSATPTYWTAQQATSVVG